MPEVRHAAPELPLEEAVVRVRVEAPSEMEDVLVHALLVGVERRYLSRSVVSEPDRRAEAKGQRASGDLQRIGRNPGSGADHGIDVHVELGVRGEPPKLLLEDLEALVRDRVRDDVVDTDLQPVEPGAIQALDAP